MIDRWERSIGLRVEALDLELHGVQEQTARTHELHCGRVGL
jgi:hypothetical protein